MNHDDLIERLTEAEVREPRRPSGAYTTTLGAQASAALRELQAERDALKAENERLRDAASAVVARWDTPNWKEADATAVSIGALRAALTGKEAG